MGRRAKLADRPPPRQMGMGRWFDTLAERRTDATGRPNSCQSWAGSISRGRRQCLSLNFGYRPRPCENASEVWVDALRFPGARADADRPAGASSLSEAIRL